MCLLVGRSGGLALRLQHLGPEHPEVAITAWGLARRLDEAGDRGKADALREAHVQPLLDADPEALPPPRRRARERIVAAEAGEGDL